MNIKRPRQGPQLTLWENLKPDQGYSSKQIYEIARQCNLTNDSVKNMLYHGTRRKYLIFDKIENLYYRSDSTRTHEKTSSEIRNLDTTDIDREAVTETVIRDLDRLKLLKQEEERMEKELYEVKREIAELSYLDKFITKHKR